MYTRRMNEKNVKNKKNMKIKNESVVAYLLLIQKETLKKKETIQAMWSRKKYIFQTIITTKNKCVALI